MQRMCRPTVPAPLPSRAATLARPASRAAGVVSVPLTEPPQVLDSWPVAVNYYTHLWDGQPGGPVLPRTSGL